MAAPTNAAKREESPCQPGAVHTWHEADLSGQPADVGFRGVEWTSSASEGTSGLTGDCVRMSWRSTFVRGWSFGSGDLGLNHAETTSCIRRAMDEARFLKQPDILRFRSFASAGTAKHIQVAQRLLPVRVSGSRAIRL